MSEYGETPIKSSDIPDCESLLELIPAYSIGATTTEESQLVELWLEDCPEAVAELETYMSLSMALLHAADLHIPPLHLHDKIMTAVDESSDTKNSLLRIVSGKKTNINRLLAFVAATAAALLIFSNLYWASQVSDLRRAQEELANSIEQQRDTLFDLGTGELTRFELMPTQDDEFLATVLWNSQEQVALLVTDHLPEIAINQTYQLWLIEGTTAVSAGVFRLDERGRGTLIFNPPASLDQYDALGISLEPVGGSSAPTTSPIALSSS